MKLHNRLAVLLISFAATILVGGAFVTATPVLAEGGATNATASAATSDPARTTLSPEQALQRLVEGNRRYVAEKAIHPDQTSQRRREVAQGQSPIAVVLTCSDSRVAPELFLDQGLGDLFVIRNAGNILDDHVIGSIEYAVDHLHVGLIVVVGHGKCGAVTAAATGGEVPGHIRSVTEAIAPAVEEVENLAGDKVENAVRANAQRAARILNHVEPFLKSAAAAGHLKIVAARYDLNTGGLEMLK